MPTIASRLSPIHHLLETRGAQWGQLGGTPIALRCGPEEAERAALPILGLCDVSALRKLGIKGPGAPTWLRDRGIELPAEVYDSLPLGRGGLVVRLGPSDFFLEDGLAGDTIPRLSGEWTGQPGVSRVEREDATFLITGMRALEVLAQMCSIDFRTAPRGRLVLTRAAGISCGILPEALGDVLCFRLWVDGGYAVYFWETLVEIAEELGGKVIGAACCFPELLALAGSSASHLPPGSASV
jgi:sarcosine oxidase subunit gamma